MSQPVFTLALPLDILNTAMQALQAQAQACSNAAQVLREQAEAAVAADRDAEVTRVAVAEKATKAASKAAKAKHSAPEEEPADALA